VAARRRRSRREILDAVLDGGGGHGVSKSPSSALAREGRPSGAVVFGYRRGLDELDSGARPPSATRRGRPGVGGTVAGLAGVGIRGEQCRAGVTFLTRRPAAARVLSPAPAARMRRGRARYASSPRGPVGSALTTPDRLTCQLDP